MTTVTPPDRASPPILDLLTRLTVAFSRRRAYPESHPLVSTAESQAFETLVDVLSERGRLSLSVGKDELLVDDEPEPLVGGVARDLSDRLRQRGIASLVFDRAVSSESLGAAIAWLAIEPATTEDGVVARTEVPTLPGVTIGRIAFGRLALRNEMAPEDATNGAIWRVLASIALDDESLEDDGSAGDPGALGGSGSGTLSRFGASRSRDGAGRGGDTSDGASLPGDTPDADAGTERASGPEARDDEHADSDAANAYDPLGDADPAEVAAAIERRLPREGYAQRVAFVLLRVADQVAHAPSAQRALLGARLRDVLGALQPASIATIITSIGAGADQRHFISQVVEALPVGAIIEWLETAARATGQQFSHHLGRLLAKLSTRAADTAASAAGEGAFRDAAREMVREWTLETRASSAHIALLDQISRFEAAHTNQALPDAGAIRLVQIALEIDEWSVDAGDAAQRLLDDGGVAELLQWVTEAPGRTAAAALKELIVSPAALRATLLREPLDQGMARALLASLDERACDTLLDVLCEAEARTTRRLVYDRLREYGPSLAPLLASRLDGAPWYFVRNLLALMRDSTSVDGGAADVTGSALFRFLDHRHEQVRVEALRLLVADAAARDLAIRHALDDSSERVVRVAIEMLAMGGHAERRRALAPDLVQRLVRFIDAAAHGEELVARAVRALVDASPSPVVRDPLLALATRRTLVLRRLMLVDARPVVVAALEVLAARYAQDTKVTTVMALAARHQDARIRNAVKPAARRADAA